MILSKKNVALILICVMAALGIHSIFFYMEERRIQPYLESGLTREKAIDFLSKYPQANSNQTWIQFAKHWSSHSEFAEEVLTILKDVNKTVRFLGNIHSQNIFPYENLDFYSWLRKARDGGFLQITLESYEPTPWTMLFLYQQWFSQIWPNCGRDMEKYIAMFFSYNGSGGNFESLTLFIRAYSLYEGFINGLPYEVSTRYLLFMEGARSLCYPPIIVLIPYPDGMTFHEEVAFVVSDDFIRILKEHPDEYGTPIVLPGNAILLFSKESARKDGIHVILMELTRDRYILLNP